MRKSSTFGFAAAALLLFSAGPASAVAIDFNQSLTGTAVPNDFQTIVDTSVLFDPLSGPVSVTGSVDINDFRGETDSVLFVGLISKSEFDAGGYNVGTVYGSGRFTDSGEPEVGIGQNLAPGEFTQDSLIVPTTSGSLGGFELLFGPDGYSLTTGSGDLAERAYSAATDFSEGAYAFITAFFGADSEGSTVGASLNYNGPAIAAVPGPSVLALFGLALVGLGAAAARRNRA